MAAPRHTPVRYPGGWKAGWGLLAWPAVYGLAALLGVRGFDTAVALTRVPTFDGTTSLATVMAAGDVTVPTWKAAGLLFYNAHLVGTVVPAPRGGWVTRNLLSNGGALMQLLFAVPPVVLVAAGLLVTRDATTVRELRYDFGSGAVRYGLNGGLSTMLGYLPLAMAGAFVFVVGRTGPDVAPDVLGAWVLAGAVYPLLFGAIGGVLGRAVARRGAVEEKADAAAGGRSGW